MKDRTHRKNRAAYLYDAATVQSRQPAFYADMGVPDTVDGRFEMLALHCGVLVYRLKKHGKTKLSQALFDRMFKQMDPMLREMGVGDLSVPKHMKRMMQGFNGRIRNYAQAIEDNNENALKEALVRNVYGTVQNKDVNQADVSALAEYVTQSTAMDTEEPVFAEIQGSESGASNSESGLPDGECNKGENNVAA